MAREEQAGGATPAASDLDATVPRSPARRRHRRWLWVAALLVIVLVVALMLVRRGKRAPSPPPAAAISAAQARSGDINIYIGALGTVTPLATVNLYSQITGRVIAVHYQEGQLVRRGAALIDIDPRPYQSTLTQAEGNLQRDQALLAEARMDLTRYQAAYARNGISRQQLEDQAQTVAQDEGTVRADQGSVDYDRVQLSYCHIVSPISGRVGLRLVDPGNTVFAGSASTLVVITQLQPITVVFDVSEDQLPAVQAQLAAGQQLPVAAYDRTDEHELDSGTLTAYDNQIDPSTGTVRLRAHFANTKLALFPNQFVNARLLLQTLHGATLVPTAAVQYNGSDSFVYLVQANHTVRVQPVTVQTSNDQDTAVQGVSPGATVVTSGFERIENGARVAIEAPAAPARSIPAAAAAPRT